MKAVVAAFNKEKALVGAFSVIANLRMDLRFQLSLVDCTLVLGYSRRLTCVSNLKMRVSLAARVAAAGELELLALCSGSLPLPDLGGGSLQSTIWGRLHK